VKGSRRAVPFALIGAVLAGCSFDPSGLTAGGNSIDAPVTPTFDAAPGTPDAPITTPDAPITSAPCPADKDLVACWRFETGQALTEPHDDTGNHNDGTSSNVTFIPSLTGHGLAMSFSPTASATVPDSKSLDPAKALTIEMWLYVRTLPPVAGRAGLLDDNNQYGFFLAPDGSVRCVIGSTTDIGLTITTNTWTHVACTYDGAAINLFQDGRAGATVSDPNGIPTASVDGTALGQNSPTGDHLDGALDDVRVWQVARDAVDLCTDAAPNC
jgi:hypothetical protein